MNEDTAATAIVRFISCDFDIRATNFALRQSLQMHSAAMLRGTVNDLGITVHDEIPIDLLNSAALVGCYGIS